MVKCVVGALLLAIPVAHFFAFGYFYALIDRARRGDSLELPDWEDWRRLFVNGITAFVIFLALGAVPIALGWLLTLPWRWVQIDFGVLVYLPMVPAIMLAGPLTAAQLAATLSTTDNAVRVHLGRHVDRFAEVERRGRTVVYGLIREGLDL